MFEINDATLSGAIDIIVIKHPDGTFKSSPFHVRFGVFKILSSTGKKVAISVNGAPKDLQMTLND
jgi:phosphatidate phosphatase LPIN